MSKPFYSEGVLKCDRPFPCDCGDALGTENVRLRATNAALLEALKGMTNWYHKDVCEDRDGCDVYCRSACAAIAAAEVTR